MKRAIRNTLEGTLRCSEKPERQAIIVSRSSIANASEIPPQDVSALWLEEAAKKILRTLIPIAG